ncbi:MAG TPA: hypothetical protein DCS74_02675 [Veillonellaceae bacterium]|nr:hypothetical protein [Veillonellaceae bacterium]
MVGLVMVMSLHGFPFLVTILKNAMLQIPPSMEEAGALFGASPAERFRKISLPLLVPAFAAGAFLVFVRTLSEYGTPATWGSTSDTWCLPPIFMIWRCWHRCSSAAPQPCR